MGDKITIYVLGINAAINSILIFLSEKKNPVKTNEANQRNFWQAYLMFVPFVVTYYIIKEIESKRKNIQVRLERDYQLLTTAWNQAAQDLQLKIKAPFNIKPVGGQEISYPILIENFGRKSGTLIFSINDRISTEFIRKYGFYDSRLNPFLYSKYNRELFMDTLHNWGYFGELTEKPEWYSKDDCPTETSPMSTF